MQSAACAAICGRLNSKRVVANARNYLSWGVSPNAVESRIFPLEHLVESISVNEHEEDFKDNSGNDKARLSKGINSAKEEASFEQLLGQLDIQGSQPAAEGSVTRLFSLVGGGTGNDSTALSRSDAEKQGTQAPGVPNVNSSESKISETPATTAQTAPPVLARQEAPGDFTRIFTKLPTPRTAQPAILCELPAANPPATPREDSFTQFFQTVEPARSPAATEPLAKAAHASAEMRSASSPHSFAAAESVPKPPSASSDTVRTPPVSGGFTELLNALGSGRTPSVGNAPVDAAFSPARPSAVSPVRRPEEARGFTDLSSAQSAAAFASSSPPDIAPRPGDFTQLLQSLQRPSENRSESSLTPIASAPAQASLNSADSNHLSSAVSSDFTRVMKSAAARASSAPAPLSASTPQQNGVVAGGPISSPALPQLPPAAAPATPVRTLLERLAPWLLAMNGVLLALLLLVASLLLLRHHH
jgi:hypothetical protein